MAGVSTTVKCHGRPGRSEFIASFMPTVVTYSCSARSSYEPISLRIWVSFSWPSAISRSSLMNES